LTFIKDCVRWRQILWTYHVNMGLARRFITREAVTAAVETYELVEAYPDDKYLPSHLLLAHEDQDAFHVLFAADAAGGNVRIVTAYRPSPNEWEGHHKRRRSR
jgi:hypothetical protein